MNERVKKRQRANSQKSTWRRINGARDEGQRYVVLYTDGLGERRVFGYADDTAGCDAQIAKIKANPSWRSFRVVDRAAKKPKQG